MRKKIPMAIAALISASFWISSFGFSQSPKTIKDITYATVNGKKLNLDLYLPAASRPPLLVWVHGGGWWQGSKERGVPLGFISSGFAIASVDYRLSGEARFPAQVHDIKAAIRFLRATALTYGYDTTRIAIGGSSAGGHLALLVGTTNWNSMLEGTVGSHLNQSSAVRAIVEYYGPSNLTNILRQSTTWGLSVRVPALQKLLGAQPDSVPALASLASPVFHVDEHDPPLLIFHGDQDPQVPINQSHEIQGVYEKYHIPVYFEVLHGAEHGGAVFYDEEHIARAVRFLREVLN